MAKGDRLRAIKQKFIGIDQFSTMTTFNVNGDESVKTCYGACMSLILVCILTSYGVYRTVAMFDRDDTFISRVLQVGKYNENDEFVRNDNLTFYSSFAISGRSLLLEEEFEKYLNVTFVHKTFDPVNWATYTAIPTEVCSNGGFEANHFPLADKSNSVNAEKFYCPKLADDFKFYGEFNSFRSSYVEIWVERCNSTTSTVTCATDKQFDEWLNYKFLVLRSNQQSFKQDKFQQKHIQSETEERWLSINPASPLRQNFNLQNQQIVREDAFFQVGQDQTDSLTNVQHESTVSVVNYWNKSTYMQIVFQMSFDSISYERKIYDILALLGDLGGVQASFETIFGWFTGSWAAIALEALLVSQLYTVKKDRKIVPQDDKYFKEGQQLSEDDFKKIEDAMSLRNDFTPSNSYLMRTCIMRMFCLGRKERILRRGYRRIEQQLDLTVFLKNMRSVKNLDRIQSERMQQILAMNQDRDVLDDACMTVESDVLDDVVPTGGDYKFTFNWLQDLLRKSQKINRGDMLLLNGLVVQSGQPRKRSNNPNNVTGKDGKAQIHPLSTTGKFIDTVDGNYGTEGQENVAIELKTINQVQSQSNPEILNWPE